MLRGAAEDLMRCPEGPALGRKVQPGRNKKMAVRTDIIVRARINTWTAAAPRGFGKLPHLVRSMNDETRELPIMIGVRM